MLQRLLLIAVFAGTFTGLAATVVQTLWAVPLIHQAEAYESGGGETAGHAHGDHHGHGHVDRRADVDLPR